MALMTAQTFKVDSWVQRSSEVHWLFYSKASGYESDFGMMRDFVSLIMYIL